MMHVHYTQHYVIRGFHPSPTDKKTSSWANQFGSQAILRTSKIPTNVRLNLDINNRNIKKIIRHVFNLWNFTYLPDRKVCVRYKIRTPNTSVTLKVIQGQKTCGRDDTGFLVPMLMQQENNAQTHNRTVKNTVRYDKYYQDTERWKVKQSHYRPGRAWGSKEAEVPRFQDIQYMKVVRLSALPTDHLYPPGNIPVTHFR